LVVEHYPGLCGLHRLQHKLHTPWHRCRSLAFDATPRVAVEIGTRDHHTKVLWTRRGKAPSLPMIARGQEVSEGESGR
jgi:hypothetical protein